MVLGVVKGHPGNAVDVLDLVCQSLGIGRGDVCDHHSGRAVGDKVVVHHRQALAGLRVIRQIGGDVVFHLYPVPGEQAEHQSDQVQQEKQVSLVYNEGSNLFHPAVFFFSVLLICHRMFFPFQRAAKQAHYPL